MCSSWGNSGRAAEKETAEYHPVCHKQPAGQQNILIHPLPRCIESFCVREVLECNCQPLVRSANSCLILNWNLVSGFAIYSPIQHVERPNTCCSQCSLRGGGEVWHCTHPGSYQLLRLGKWMAGQGR
jgi:hypothetical protein